jgi:hypothetical protein
LARILGFVVNNQAQEPAMDRDRELEPTEARQGERRVMVRRTLAISLALAVVLIFGIYFFFLAA